MMRSSKSQEDELGPESNEAQQSSWKGSKSRQSGNSNPSKKKNKIFVGGLPPKLRNYQLVNYFKSFGPLQEAKIMFDKDTRKSRGFAFVTFVHEKSVAQVLSQSHVIEGKEVDCKPAFSKAKARHKILREKEKKLFIGGLSPDTTENDLRVYFMRFGRLEKAQIILEPNTKKSRGFGFVVFREKKALTRVLKVKDQHYLKGKWIDCKPALLRDEIKKAGSTTRDHQFDISGQQSQEVSHLHRDPTFFLHSESGELFGQHQQADRFQLGNVLKEEPRISSSLPSEPFGQGTSKGSSLREEGLPTPTYRLSDHLNKQQIFAYSPFSRFTRPFSEKKGFGPIRYLPGYTEDKWKIKPLMTPTTATRSGYERREDENKKSTEIPHKLWGLKLRPELMKLAGKPSDPLTPGFSSYFAAQNKKKERSVKTMQNKESRVSEIYKKFSHFVQEKSEESDG